MILGESERRLWWQAFAGFTLLMSLWALSMPLFASPDENAHVSKAASVARGQLLGDLRANPAGDPLTVVSVPGAQVSEVPCYAHKPAESAACQVAATSSTDLVEVTTLAGRYPPLYYAITGPASVLVPDRGGVYLMRFVSVLLSAAFLASALLSVRRWRSGFGALGLAAAVSPMVIFLSSGVNPSGMEITAAICTWASLLTLLDDPAAPDRRLVVRLGVAATFLVLCRGLSPLWLAVIVLVACIPTGLSAIRTALAPRDVQVCAAVVTVAGLAALVWVRHANALALRPDPGRVENATGDPLSQSFSILPDRLTQMIGVFGWLDATPPLWTFVIWVGVLALLILLCLTTAAPRGVLALVVLIGVTVMLPVALEASQADALGFIWQGRYTLPIAVGVPLLAARLIDPHGDALAPHLVRRLVTTGVALLMSAQLVSFVWDLRRYTVGTDRGLVDGLGITGTLGWNPPLAPVLLVVGAVVALTALGWLLARVVPADGRQSPAPERGRHAARENA